MAASGAEEGGQLIPGLPEEVVLAEVVPRLPWYTRPVCRALSKSWKTLLDTKSQELDLRTRMIQVPLLRGVFLFNTSHDQICISDNDDLHVLNGINGCPHWRKLPLLKCSMPAEKMVAGSGMVYAWSWTKSGLQSVSKLDLGCADWTWKKVPFDSSFFFQPISFNERIYMSTLWRQTLGTLEHDMMTDICRQQVAAWNQKHLRFLLRRSACSNVCVEELYGVEERDFVEKIRVVVYDARSDSWRTRAEVPTPWMPLWPSQVQLLNSDCFEPASETEINIVLYEFCDQQIYWFNPSLGTTWVDICYNPLFDGIFNDMHYDQIRFIQGSMYKTAWKIDTNKDGSLSTFCRKAIMKGKIIVESRALVWEEVYDIGLDCYTGDRYTVTA